METAAVSEERPRPTPLADLALLVALVAPGVLAVWAGLYYALPTISYYEPGSCFE